MNLFMTGLNRDERDFSIFRSMSKTNMVNKPWSIWFDSRGSLVSGTEYDKLVGKDHKW